MTNNFCDVGLGCLVAGVAFVLAFASLCVLPSEVVKLTWAQATLLLPLRTAAYVAVFASTTGLGRVCLGNKS